MRTLLASVPLAAACVAAHAQIAVVGSAQSYSPQAPQFQAAGPEVSGTGSVTPSWPAHQVNDVALLFCESPGSQPVSLSTPAGFTAVAGSPVATGGGAGTRLTVFWARATSASMPSPVVADPGNHVYCRILTYRGVATSGNPWDVTGGGVKPTASTSVTVTGVTTTVSNTLIVQAVARNNDSPGAAFSGQTNPDLANITERSDSGTSAGNGGGIGIWDGIKYAPGLVGDTAATVVNSVNAFLTIALRPQPDAPLTIPVPAGTAANHVMIASIAFRPCSSASGGACTTTITPPAGWTQVNSVTDQTTGGGTGGFGSRLFVYLRVATASEPASYTWNLGGAPVHNGAVGGIITFSGVDTTSPVVAEAGQATGSATSHTAPSINTSPVTNTMLVTSHSANSSTSWTPPAGMTERVDVASIPVADDLGISLEVNTEPFATAGATGVRTAGWTAPPAADTGLTHMLALRPAAIVHHYAITVASTTVANCDAAQVTITAHNAAHLPVNPPSGRTVTLSVSAGAATAAWQTLLAGSGTWTPSGATATYVWPGSESSFTVTLRQSAVLSLSVNANDTFVSEDPAEDPTLSFVNSAFRISNGSNVAATIGTHLAGKRSDVGFGAQNLFLQAIRTDTSTGACTSVFPSGAEVDIEVGAQCNNPSSCTQSVTLTTTATSGSPSGSFVPAGSGTYPATIRFRFTTANAEAPFYLSYADAGQITLQFRYVTPAPAVTITGTSNTFVVRPFGLRVSGVTTSASPSPADPAAYVAGQNFNVTVTAVQWKSGDDADANGVPDSDAQIAANAATPNFGQESTPATATLSHTLNAPSGGSAGSLGGATTFSGFSGGSKTQAVNWSEVGFINLFAGTTNYLGSGQNVTNSSAGLTGVGRFRPAHFAASGASLANRTDKTCAPPSAFTYLGEQFGLTFTLQARNTAGAVTQNYTGTYAKLGLGTFTNYNLGARSGGTPLTPRLAGLSASGSWASGAATPSLAALIARAASPEPPFTGVEFGIAPTDSDGVAMNTLDFDADADTVNERKRLDGVSGELRYGRIRLENANGSELLDLPVPMRLEYYAGVATGWQKNTADTCSVIAASDFAFAFPADPKNQLAACETRAIVAGTPPDQTLVLEKPGAGNQGWTDLTLNLAPAASGNTCIAIGGPGPAASTANMPYLQFKWRSPSDENPAARATFGMQPSRGPIIYRRERY